MPSKLVICAKVPGQKRPLYFTTGISFVLNPEGAKQYESEDPMQLDQARRILRTKFSNPEYAALNCWKGRPFEEITVEFDRVQVSKPDYAMA